MGDLVWETNPDAAFTLANQTGKPVMMLFTAEWCGPCRHMHDGRARRRPGSTGGARQIHPALHGRLSEPTDSPAQQMSEVYSGGGSRGWWSPTPRAKALTTQIGSMDTANFLRWIEQN